MTALAAAGALVLSGCGSSGTAAVVDGRVISESAVLTATGQVNDWLAAQAAANKSAAPTPVTPDTVLNLLIWSPSLIAEAGAAGQPQSAAAAESMLTGVQHPDPATIEVIRAENSLRAVQSDSGATQKVLARIAKLHVSVNPRYGSYDPKTGTLQTVQPNWFASTPTG